MPTPERDISSEIVEVIIKAGKLLSEPETRKKVEAVDRIVTRIIRPRPQQTSKPTAA